MGEIVELPKNENNSISLYDFNKVNMAQIKPYDDFVLHKRCSEVIKEIWNKPFENQTYWMLLCRERNDYTIFCIKYSIKEAIDALEECLRNRGKILDITKQEDGNFEIWIRDFDTNENVVYYLFDYNGAIIEV